MYVSGSDSRYFQAHLDQKSPRFWAFSFLSSISVREIIFRIFRFFFFLMFLIFRARTKRRRWCFGLRGKLFPLSHFLAFCFLNFVFAFQLLYTNFHFRPEILFLCSSWILINFDFRSLYFFKITILSLEKI